MRILNQRLLAVLFALLCVSSTVAAENDVDLLIAAMLGDTPLIDDLHELTDTIGGRVTGTAANKQAVAWAEAKFRTAEVAVSTEEFEMPYGWRENRVEAAVSGDVGFDVGVVAKPFSAAASALNAPLLDAGLGSADDFARLGKTARGAWVLIDTPVLNDEIGLGGLFAEYSDAAQIEPRAFAAGVAGLVFLSSRPNNLVYRHNAALGGKNEYPLLIIEREHGKRAQRLLRDGKALSLTATVEIDAGDAFTATNVLGEIRGSVHPEEIVLFGAHLDSFALGTGALDNGVNVAMMINIARQIVRLGLRPERTIRFALWNGEEQGLVGSWKYTEQHEDELDQHIVAASFDIGSGRTIGYFTGGRPELVKLVDKYLEPVAGLGPFQQIDAPIVGTDNFDFMMEGVPNLVANQADANYASNYHAESDTFDKVDQRQVRLNSAIAAAVLWGFANSTDRLPRQSHDEIEALIDDTDLEKQMRDFAVWDGWAAGQRGRHD